VPGGSSGIIYKPDALVVTVRTSPVSGFLTVTVAPATTASVGSPRATLQEIEIDVHDPRVRKPLMGNPPR
jgi:hypothetical protein